MSSEAHSLETDIVQDTIKDTVEEIVERCGDREIKSVVMLVGEFSNKFKRWLPNLGNAKLNLITSAMHAIRVLDLKSIKYVVEWYNVNCCHVLKIRIVLILCSHGSRGPAHGEEFEIGKRRSCCDSCTSAVCILLWNGLGTGDSSCLLWYAICSLRNSHMTFSCN
jgi:hypothetical protein